MIYKYIFLLCLLVLLECFGVGYLAFWREFFWTSVANKELYNFIKYMAEFSVVVLILTFISGYRGYIVNYFSLLLRTELTNKILYKDDYHDTEGHRQRIQEDCRDYPQLSLTLITGLGMAFIQVLMYSCIIIYSSSWSIYLIALIYTAIGTYLAQRIARPLIDLNYHNQVTEAAFRQDLTQLSYGKVFNNNWMLFIKLKYLQYFQSFFGQISIIIPMLILAPSYFHGIITFGVLMQLNACIGEIINQGAYGINQFDVINKFLSCKKRLKQMRII